MPPNRTFDKTTGILRFSVPLQHGDVTATISQTTWQARYGLGNSDSSFVEIYIANQPMIDAAVARKVNAGARIPVVLKAADL